MSNLSKAAAAAAAAALALNGGGDQAAVHLPPVNQDPKQVPVPECYMAPVLPQYHDEDRCAILPKAFAEAKQTRSEQYATLRDGATGATMVPNQQTVICPREVQNLENPSAIKGFDTVWIVENTASTPIAIAWVTDGQEWSPWHPDVKPQDDPDCILKPGEWKAVPTFESFVYHARELTEEGPGNILLQHRAGLVPLGNKNGNPCDASLPDVEPITPETAERKEEFARTPTHGVRRCNTIDLGFRNQVGCPLNVYWAGNIEEVPDQGFNCGEHFKFHIGTKPATQDFMHDWESSTKFEGTFIGHTFVARLASNPEVVIDSYTLQPTRVIDCPNLKQIPISDKQGQEMVVEAQGNTVPLGERLVNPASANLAGAGMTSTNEL
jgi:hypothetical protein